MIKTNPKKCKGTGHAINQGCGQTQLLFKYGLCQQCFKQFLKTEKGLEVIQKYTIKASKLNSLKEKKQTIAENKQKSLNKKQATIDLMSNDKYRSQIIQPLINQIARLIDYGLPCIATQTYGQIHGGHFISVGANRTTALNLHNIHRQSAYSNTYNHGDITKYRNGLIQDYSHNYLEFIEQLQQTPTLNLTKENLKQIHEIANSIIKELKQFIKTLQEPITPEQRIYLRNIYNQQLNIYTIQFSTYTTKQLSQKTKMLET